MCCEHDGQDHQHEVGILGKNTELYFAVLSGVFLFIGFLIDRSMAQSPQVLWYLYVPAYFFGGYFMFLEAVQKIAKGGFEIDFLMLVAALGAGFLGKWAEGALLLFLFSLGHALEHYAMGKARKSIAALTGLAPTTALLKKDGGTVEVAIGDVEIGDTIVIRPGSKIAADGFIVMGSSSVDQSPITGESIPVDKVPVKDEVIAFEDEKYLQEENKVFSGTINGNTALEVRVTRLAVDSTLSRLITMVHKAEKQKSPTQLLTDNFQKYYVPAVIFLVVALNFAFLVVDETWSASFYRSMAVLVAASPCALAISTPSAVLSGIARAARGGVLIKGGRPLEDLGTLTALAFDKTGTLTEGKPRLTDVVPLGNMDRDTLLRITIAVESLSDHPLAKAVVRDGMLQLKVTDVPHATHLEAIQGRGVKAVFEGRTIIIGNLKIYSDLDGIIPKTVVDQVMHLESEGKTTMLVRQEDTFIGILGLMDVPRKEAKQTLLQLSKLGIKKMVMLTGDNQVVADAIAQQIGMTEAYGGLLPEEKAAAILDLKVRERKLGMIGDGVNDAPAMANSTVGIAMGAAGSDVALETADIALLADRLETLPFAIGLSRKAISIIRQNLWISLGMVAILITATILDWVNIGVAVVFHEGSTLLVVLNALRLLVYKK
tara:strand:+ start:4605 stop:6578 length:1974 start_codon:yes stop_codon:yes gene_type:complete